MKKNRKINKKSFIIIVSTVVFVLGLSSVFLHNYLINNSLSTSSLPDEKPLELTGIVTSISTNCGKKRTLIDMGVIETKNIFCDGGDSIKVNSTSIQTASGNVPESMQFSYDISGIDLNDKVKVKYVLASNGNGYLRCKECSVIKQ